jgi:hypothetical protein
MICASVFSLVDPVRVRWRHTGFFIDPRRRAVADTWWKMYQFSPGRSMRVSSI